MSTLTFFVYQRDEPSQDEPIQQKAIRAMIAYLLDVPIGKLSSTWSIGHHRKYCCSAHAEIVPQAWLKTAEALIRYRFINGYEWSGQVEMAKHDGILDKTGKVSVCINTDVPFEDGIVHLSNTLTEDTVSLLASEALSLLAWLKQEEGQLVSLAQEETNEP